MSKREKILDFLNKQYQLQNINYQILTGKFIFYGKTLAQGVFDRRV
jgi:hypothetical protein